MLSLLKFLSLNWGANMVKIDFQGVSHFLVLLKMLFKQTKRQKEF